MLEKRERGRKNQRASLPTGLVSRASWFYYDWQGSKRTKIRPTGFSPVRRCRAGRMHDLCALLNSILVDSANPNQAIGYLFRGGKRPLFSIAPFSFSLQVQTFLSLFTRTRPHVFVFSSSSDTSEKGHFFFFLLLSLNGRGE